MDQDISRIDSWDVKSSVLGIFDQDYEPQDLLVIAICDDESEWKRDGFDEAFSYYPKRKKAITFLEQIGWKPSNRFEEFLQLLISSSTPELGKFNYSEIFKEIDKFYPVLIDILENQTNICIKSIAQNILNTIDDERAFDHILRLLDEDSLKRFYRCPLLRPRPFSGSAIYTGYICGYINRYFTKKWSPPSQEILQTLYSIYLKYKYPRIAQTLNNFDFDFREEFSEECIDKP